MRRKRIKDLITTLLRCPPHHARHQSQIQAFEQKGEYEKSVFIMTKYPERDDPRVGALGNVISVVKSAVAEFGFVPRIASQAEFYGDLWQNVELYMLGCSRGIAIVEDRFAEQMNANVAMEWGWMRGNGKPVLFLIDRACKQKPADVNGLLRHEFDWENPGDGINAAIGSFLNGPQAEVNE